MRAVFINYSHPDTPHVSGMRVSRFAVEMAKRGHQIVLLTRPLGGERSSVTPGELAPALIRHDWRSPFHLACAPQPAPRLERLREGGIAPWLSKMIVFREYLLHGGMFHDWVAGMQPYWKTLADAFKPDVTWGTFGNSDTLWIGRAIARLAGASWCVDIKDNWERFIPGLFRRSCGWRAGQAAAITANSDFHGRLAMPWTGRPFNTVYSGYQETGPSAGPGPWAGNRVLFVGGSIYADATFQLLVQGVEAWWNTRPAGTPFLFAYAGADHDRVSRILAGVSFPCRIMPFMAPADYALRCRQAWANAYVWSPRTFHHKAVELLAAGRPVLAIGGEHEETLELAERVGGTIRVCRTAPEVAAGLAAEGEADRTGGMTRRIPPRMEDLSWPRQADVLEKILLRAARGSIS